MRTGRFATCLAIVAGLTSALFVGCDHGLAPPDRDAFGAIRGTITYEGTWPPADSLFDLRFVGMRFIPEDTTDFLQLNRMVISAGLRRNVPEDTFTIENVEEGVLVYNGIAQKFGPGILDWRPAALFEENSGTITIREGEVATIAIRVDFATRPTFPPNLVP